MMMMMMMGMMMVGRLGIVLGWMSLVKVAESWNVERVMWCK